MKALAVLVEYLVIGAVAALWLVPAFLQSSFFTRFASKDLLGFAIAALIPSFYVVGMICDLLGYHATHWLKKRIERVHGARRSSQLLHVFAICNEPDLAKEMDIRSTRDRVARGAMVAIIPLLFTD
ncbi:hypothetical protein [Cupriavidus lacunae]|uniref:Uncharacterized protein n=1 Tax=Cupriavidus lacunae TaxID=2666307 RepID=A0A370NP24_9BURK|nr:hypothetical protein [Cupriavidus lacunae]RDK07357.1 hypothetical protein DN412_26605 [Cupriavidus lacunae]